MIRALAVAATLALSACVAGGGVTSPGYVSGDGLVTEWAAAERGDPIAVSGVDYSGNAVDSREFLGQVVVINTWYASCPPCRVEVYDLIGLDARDDVQVIGVNFRDDAGTAQAFERSFGVTYPSIDDNDGAAIATLHEVVAVNAVPTTIILDPQGRIAARAIGLIEPSTLTALVDAAGLA